MQTIKNYIKERGTLFTIFGAVMILFGGIAIIDSPEYWWVAPSVIIGLFLVVLLFIQARVVIKATITIFTTMLVASGGFFVGTSIDPVLQLAGLIWFFSAIVLALLNLSISYLVFSVRSRWTVTTLSLIVQFTVVYFMILSIEDIYWSVAVGSLVGLLTFLALYLTKGIRSYYSKKMPGNIASDVLTENIEQAFTEQGYHFRDLRKKGNKGGFLVWKDKAFLVYPIHMDNEFQEYTRAELRYNNKNVNSWLAMVAARNTPSFRARNASIMTVLLDLRNGNGNSGKVIGMSTPDTKVKTPVGIFPGRELNSSRENKSGIIKNFEKRFAEYAGEITEKQHKALEGIGQEK